VHISADTTVSESRPPTSAGVECSCESEKHDLDANSESPVGNTCKPSREQSHRIRGHNTGEHRAVVPVNNCYR
jgi:hypothetical protein